MIPNLDANSRVCPEKPFAAKKPTAASDLLLAIYRSQAAAGFQCFLLFSVHRMIQ